MRYEAPTSVSEAAKLLAKEKGLARILAGGTDLIVQMKSGMIEPDLVVDIKRIDALKRIKKEKGGFRVGAAVSGAEMEEHEELCALWPGVVEATNLIGSTQVQGRATMAGNLCNASPAADCVPALVAADAVARVVGPKKGRDVPVIKMTTGPGKTTLKRGEFVESIFLPSRKKRSGDAYLRFIPRTEMDIAVVGAGVSLTLDKNGKCSDARLSLGAVAAKVLLVERAAKILIGSNLDEETLEKFAAAASAAAKPIDDKRGTVDFRKKVSGVLARRAAIIAAERAMTTEKKGKK